MKPKIVPAKSIESELSNALFLRLQQDRAGFQKLGDLLRDLCGIHLPLNEKNLSLLASRLCGFMKAKNLKSYDEYLGFLNSGDEDTIQEFISNMTTNTTHFFRESNHFQLVKEIFVKLAQGKRGNGDEIRVWCAACSTGQEAYSIAITAAECLGPGAIERVKILATDLDTTVLERAYSGTYSTQEIESLPAMYRQKYFETVGDKHRAKQLLKRHLEFGEFNLSAASYPFSGRFDIVFCRNVLIYFDKPMVASVIKNLTQSLAPGGHLFLGHSESGSVRDKTLNSVAVSAYMKAA